MKENKFFLNLIVWRKFFSGRLKKKINFINLFDYMEKKIIF